MNKEVKKKYWRYLKFSDNKTDRTRDFDSIESIIEATKGYNQSSVIHSRTISIKPKKL